MRRLTGRGPVALPAALLAALILPAAAGGATITPDILIDEDADNGACSLREAVTAANTDGDYNGCVASADEGADTIVLQSGSTYALGGAGLNGVENANASGDLDVSAEPLTIQASGAAAATIDANGATSLDRVLDLDPTNTGGVTSVNINDLALTDGNDSAAAGGGAIRHGGFAGSLAIDDSRLFGNDSAFGGGAVLRLDGSSTTITDSSIDSNTGGGAAIFHEMGTLTISRSTISGQSASSAGDVGGAIVKTSGGTATLANTTISGNSTKGSGGGIFQNQGTLNLRNATIAFNSADSDAGGTPGDGGGVFASGGTVNVRNSIIADNLDLTGAPPAHPDCSGTIVSEGHNLIEDTTGCTVNGDVTGNVLGTPPMLVILGLNGGPTATHRFPPGAPPDNAGNPALPGSGGTACEATDQRGHPRDASTGSCDIGAYERQPPVLDPIGDKTVQAGQNLSFGLAAVDPDPGDNLDFSGSNLPAGAGVVPGEFSWTPSQAQVGAHPDVTISVSDGSLTDSEAITITVTAAPGPDPVKPQAKKKKCKKGQKRKKVKGKVKCVKKKRKKKKRK